MKIYDISQELFSCCVFPGDPAPARERVLEIKKGDSCNLTSLSMCAHNGTHVDAPYHFYADGKTVDQLDLSKLVGEAQVIAFDGELSGEDMERLLCGAPPRILLKGKAVVTLEAAKAMNRHGVVLVGVESQTVGPEDGPRAVHLELLGQEVVLLEGIRLGEVPEGKYLLNAAPLNLGGADGAPCRALLLSMDEGA
ncbi:MAG: cyclase family protein [Eubacteriales bacterium]|nr:cyclase family protein [Eubacteriales bacterium]